MPDPASLFYQWICRCVVPCSSLWCTLDDIELVNYKEIISSRNTRVISQSCAYDCCNVYLVDFRLVQTAVLFDSILLTAYHEVGVLASYVLLLLTLTLMECCESNWHNWHFYFLVVVYKTGE